MCDNKLMNTLNQYAPEFISGEGPYLLTRQGDRYLDFFCDVGTSSLGYCSGEHERVFLDMKGGRIPIHVPNLFNFEERNIAAERLCYFTKMDKVFFCNSGTEAVEAAIKLARLYQYRRFERDFTYEPGKRFIYTVKGSFHGRTLGSLSAGDGPPHHTEGFGPLTGGFRKFESLEEIDPHLAIAVLIAPVFGNNDVLEYDRNWLVDLRTKCNDHNITLIFDEVQTGAGRCGNFTYAKKIGVQPDVMTMAKGIAMGCPVGACLAMKPFSETFTSGTHFSTFGGNPIGMAHVNGMLDYLEYPHHMESINDKSVHVKSVLKKIGYPKNVRGTGLLIAYDSPHDVLELGQECLKRGLLIGAFRKGPGPVKITPPLNIAKVDLDRGLTILEQAHSAMELKSRC